MQKKDKFVAYKICQTNPPAKYLGMVLQSQNGYPEAIPIEACDISLFYKTADWLAQHIEIKFVNKSRIRDTTVWQFPFEGSLMQLKHTNEYGVSISPALESQATGADRTSFDILIKALKGFTG